MTKRIFFITPLLLLAGAGLLLSGCGTPRVAVPEKTRKAPVVRPAPRPVAKQPRPTVHAPARAEKTRPEKTKTVEPAIKVPLAGEVLRPPSREKIRFSQADLRFVEQRLATYEKKFRQWLETRAGEAGLDRDMVGPLQWQGCSGEFERILAGYQRMRERIIAVRNAVPWDDNVQESEMSDILQQDIAFMEGRCGPFPGAGPDEPAARHLRTAAISWKMAAQSAEALIAAYVNQGNDIEAIAAFQSLGRKFPGHLPEAVTRQQYGLALLRTGQRQAATAVFSRLAAEAVNTDLKQIPWQRQHSLADLLLAAGDLTGAQSLYQQLARAHAGLAVEHKRLQVQVDALRALRVDRSEETNAYLTLFRGVTLFSGRQGGPALIKQADRFDRTLPGTPLAASARYLRQTVEERLTAWAGSRLQRVNTLMKQGNEQQAKSVLLELAGADLLPAVQERVETMLTGINAGPGVGGEPVVIIPPGPTAEQEPLSLLTGDEVALQEQSLAMQWEAANRSLEMRRYDEAIKGFTALLPTDYGAMAGIKIKTVAKQVAAENRKQAAILFAKATRTTSPDRKKELLLSSRRLLADIIEKYPQAGIMDKVRRNLENLDRYIRRYDPTLLEGKYPSPEGPALDAP
ncbi:MAG: hypothetical protein L3J03_04155 [Desulfobacterales bacterium]|nr:hypothetical protein [Desulfobacterales bacterium]